jgi:hypothetical protein
LSVAQGVVLRLDLDKAIRTRGQERDGQTPLDSLTLPPADAEHRATARASPTPHLKAKAGNYTASG